MLAKVDATATNARQTGATLATECIITNANKRVSVVALARFRCSSARSHCWTYF